MKWLFTLVGLLLSVASAQLEVRFLDVGRGDAVLIRAPTGEAVLYDAAVGATIRCSNTFKIWMLSVLTWSSPHTPIWTTSAGWKRLSGRIDRGSTWTTVSVTEATPTTSWKRL